MVTRTTGRNGGNPTGNGRRSWSGWGGFSPASAGALTTAIRKPPSAASGIGWKAWRSAQSTTDEGHDLDDSLTPRARLAEHRHGIRCCYNLPGRAVIRLYQVSN